MTHTQQKKNVSEPIAVQMCMNSVTLDRDLEYIFFFVVIGLMDMYELIMFINYGNEQLHQCKYIV